MARQALLCHGCGGSFPHRHGAGLFCSQECEEQHRAAQEIMEEALRAAGFNQSADVCNLWERDGVHISIEKVMREGLHQALAQHQRAVDERL